MERAVMTRKRAVRLGKANINWPAVLRQLDEAGDLHARLLALEKGIKLVLSGAVLQNLNDEGAWKLSAI